MLTRKISRGACRGIQRRARPIKQGPSLVGIAQIHVQSRSLSVRDENLDRIVSIWAQVDQRVQSNIDIRDSFPVNSRPRGCVWVEVDEVKKRERKKSRTRDLGKWVT